MRLPFALLILAVSMVAACDDKRPQPAPAPTHSPPNQDDCTPRPGENRTC